MIQRVAGLVCALLLLLTVLEDRCDAAEPLRLVIAVGHRSGLAGEQALKHAARDATRVRDLFVQLGSVRAEHAFLLGEPTQAQLFATIDKAVALAAGRRREDVSLVFYFSGHGDREALHLGLERVLLRDIESRLAAVPAALRIMVTDACRTAEWRGKGVTSDEPFAITFDAPSGAAGVIRVNASADGEIAQESDELGGAVFTHYWLSGLAGAADTNGDAAVTFSEAYAFAYSQTLFRSARTSGVVQRPALQSDVREGAPIVLTRTARSAGLKLPRAADVHYIVYGVGSRSVVGELWSAADRSAMLALSPGKYIVQRRAGGHSAAMQLDLGKDEQRELHAADFHAVPEETLARKGGEAILFPSELAARYAVRSGRLYDVGHELSLGVAHGWDTVALGVSALGGLGAESRPEQESSSRWLGAEAFAEVRLRLGEIVVRAGGGPRVLGLFQTLTRSDAARLTRAGYDPERSFRGVAVGAHALAGGRVALGPRAWVELDAVAELLGARIEDSAGVVWSVGAGTGLGLAF